MGEKIVIGPINKGLKTDRTAFVIDNDSFPTLINAYQWRGRIKRKRGTSLLTRFQRFFNSTNLSYNSGPMTITLGNDGSGNGTGNLLTGFITLENNSSIVQGSITITDTTNANETYTDSSGILTGSTGGTGTINYVTGAFVINSAAAHVVSATFSYYPQLPVMGLEDFIISTNAFPGTIGFDTKYAYNINTASPYSSNDVSFYKNPAADSTNLPGYIPKTTWTPLTWNGQNYQQFYTTNYQGAMWATNGINIPFSITNIGMQFAGGGSSNVITFSSFTATTLTVSITNCPLIIGDFVFVNEWTATGGTEAQNITNSATLNFQSGYVTAAAPNTPALATKTITITFPFAAITSITAFTPGIIQYLTNRSDVTKDSLRWYDGDPTNGSSMTPVFVDGSGWVNFCPPLDQFVFSIADTPVQTYYLVGARLIVPFKDRLLFFGPVIQTAAGNDQVYLQDTVIYSQNGTPYYTASFTGDPVSADTVFNPILIPINQTASAAAWFEDQTGFGGFITAGIDQPITTTAFNEDVIIVGFSRLQTRLAYTGNDIVPFNFFSINTEYGASSTFSTITLDQGVITRGSRGYTITSQVGCQRIDLEIPDQVFEINETNNGTERFCAGRDFINEWIYFSYPSNDQESEFDNNYPNQTLQYNYRDNSWAIFNESYTTYGAFRRQTGFTWNTVGNIFHTWEEWNEPWDAGNSTLLQPEVIAGNQQGFVLARGEGTGEGASLAIQNISGNTVTSIDHGLNEGDYIIINGCIGDVESQVNGQIFSVGTITENSFTLNPGITALSYSGGGLITRMYVPFIQTKQFPVAWQFSRKTRLGPQQYLLSTTQDSQITLLIFLSQNSSSSYNNIEFPLPVQLVPSPGSLNNSLIYSTVLYTCPESTNLGLTPANVNLQMPTAIQQDQIWHRVNTSLIGDTVQLGFTMSDSQMRDLEVDGTPFPITGATMANPCVLTCAGQFETGQLVTISGVVGMIQLNGNPYQVIVSDSTTVTIAVNATAFTAYVSGGTATPVAGINGFAEIELHSILMDVQPSQLLA